MTKHLIINPTKDQKSKSTTINPVALKKTIFDKILGSATYPLVIRDTHMARLISSIEYKVKSLTNYTGQEVSDANEAGEYLNKVANEVYGTGWEIKLVKSEIMYAKPTVFNITCTDEEVVQQICNVLTYVATVEVNKPAVKKNTTTEGSKTTQE